jgi:hypothetical protein
MNHGGALEITLDKAIQGKLEIDLGGNGFPIDMLSIPVTADAVLIKHLPGGS